MRYTFIPTGICVTQMRFDIDENAVISNIEFDNGCDGNLKVLAKVLNDKTVSEIISIGRGNTCGRNPTSCMDQFSIGVEKAAKELGISY